jgi:hypothetical protein
VSVARGSSEESIDLSTAPTTDEPGFAIAALAAATRLSWAWDCCATIAVTINDAHFSIVPQFTGTDWEAVEITLDAA